MVPRPSINIRSKGQRSRSKVKVIGSQSAKRRSIVRRELCTLSSAESVVELMLCAWTCITCWLHGTIYVTVRVWCVCVDSNMSSTATLGSVEGVYLPTKRSRTVLVRTDTENIWYTSRLSTSGQPIILAWRTLLYRTAGLGYKSVLNLVVTTLYATDLSVDIC